MWSILDILCDPVMILNASFCARCILPMLVSLAFMLQTGAALFAIDLPNALYVISKVSFCCPQLVPANAFKTLFLLLTLLATCTQCLLNEKKVSRYTPSVNRVQVVLSGFSKRLFCFVQAKTLCRYGCMYFLAALVLVCVDVIVMLSA